MLDYFGVGQYLDGEQFSELFVKGREFRINTKELIRSTAHGAFYLREYSWEPLRKSELKLAMNVSFSQHPREVVYAERLEKLYQEVEYGNPPVFWLA